ncbi:MAG: hypothetical protein JW855_00765, partial [Gammaproteobacteria bacterium]|nr:hypothetical protein [Gammaproteobacteria bacterium]
YEKDKKSSGLGGSVDLEQLLSEQLKFDLNANLQRAYDDYKGGVSYLMHTKPDSRLELGITAEHIRGHLSLPNDNRFGVNVGYIWGANPAEGLASYHMAQENQNFSSQLLNWTMTPAVHMAKVLAIKDEKVVWTPKDPTSTPIDDNWTAVGAMFHYDVSSHFQANGDQGIFAYSLISTIAHALGADEKVDLGIDQNSGLISSNETVSTDAVDTRITVSADKISRGQKIGPTQNQSFTVYVEPTSRQAIITIPSVTTEFACFIDINSPDSNKGDFKSHGGQLVYQLSGDDSGLTINATTGKITGAKPPGITDHIHVTAYKKDAPDTGNHTTTWTFRIECIKIPIPPIPA